MPDLVWRSVTELSRMIQTKEVSPVEVVRAFLERVAALDGKLKAFITVCADAALEAARAAEAELVAGRPAGPLHGVPYGPKDLYNTRGVRTTGGSKILADFVPTDDATVVSRLRAAGAIVLGKLNMHEFAYGPEGLNAHYGDAMNPRDGRGLCADARRDGRLRPRGSDDERPARARLPGGAHGRGEGAPRGASARPLHRRRGARSP